MWSLLGPVPEAGVEPEWRVQACSAVPRPHVELSKSHVRSTPEVGSGDGIGVGAGVGAGVVGAGVVGADVGADVVGTGVGAMHEQKMYSSSDVSTPNVVTAVL